jgi:hypothetical protein
MANLNEIDPNGHAERIGRMERNGSPHSARAFCRAAPYDRAS